MSTCITTWRHALKYCSFKTFKTVQDTRPAIHKSNLLVNLVHKQNVNFEFSYLNVLPYFSLAYENRATSFKY